MESSRVIVLLAAVLLGLCDRRARSSSPQLEDHQRLANALHPRVQVQGGWAPEDNLGVVQTVFWRGGFGGIVISSGRSSAHRAAIRMRVLALRERNRFWGSRHVGRRDDHEPRRNRGASRLRVPRQPRVPRASWLGERSGHNHSLIQLARCRPRAEEGTQIRAKRLQVARAVSR